MDRNSDIITFVLNTFLSKRPGLASFADIINIAIMLIKIAYKDSTKIKRTRKNVSKCIFSCISQYNKIDNF